jgi:hypothetical protein
MYWPGIRKDVISYVKSCFSCQRAKHSTQRPPGLMTALPVPPCPWSVIGIDFIVKLPVSSGFDSILVIVDHLTKGVHLVAANKTWDSKEFVFAFLDCFIRLHGLPDKIVSNRGALFVSKFWLEVQRLLRVQSAPSTAWHPQTDGQTERANQTIETFLWHFVSDKQDNWSQLLPVAELVFNNSVSASTGFSPFFPNMPSILGSTCSRRDQWSRRQSLFFQPCSRYRNRWSITTGAQKKFRKLISIIALGKVRPISLAIGSGC